MEFERGKDIKHTVGIGQKAQIDKWFEEWAPQVEYVINQNLSIEVRGRLDLSYCPIASLPDNLSVRGSLDLRNTKIISLPDNLSVGRYLDLRYTRIISLSDSLKVGDNIFKDF